MNIEIEAKVRVADIAPVEARLEDLDAELAGRMTELNIFFDTDQRELKRSDRGLRIREAIHDDGRSTVTITHKGPRMHGRLKKRREDELDVDSVERAVGMLDALGYHEIIRFEKRRRRYRLDGCVIELDEVPYLGCFVEIEGPDDQTILNVRAGLGLDREPLISSSYVAMLQTHLVENRIETREIGFKSAAAPSA